jgi:mono/diheme cytochrome c family protein
MKDLLVALALLSGPVAVFAIFGNFGPNSLARESGVITGAAPDSPVLAGLVEECADCHGRLAQGTARGPNLIHADYGPGKRSDDQFRRSVREGLPDQRGYGEMPAMPGVSRRNLDRMIVLLRELQRANGIR